jgi:signal transduction histidine kinase
MTGSEMSEIGQSVCSQMRLVVQCPSLSYLFLMRHPRVATPTTGMSALVGVLLVVFLIAGLLVYEAWSTGRSRREIAQRGLQDYAAYATWSTARTGDATMTAALATLFRELAGNRIRSGDPIPPITRLTSGARYVEQCECALVLPAEYYFRVDLRDSSVVIARGNLRIRREETAPGWAAAKVGSFAGATAQATPLPDGRWLPSALAASGIQRSPGFGVIFVRRSDSTRAVGYVQQRDSSNRLIGLFGFVVSPSFYARTLFTQLWRNPKILPAAITRGMPNDSLLTASVSTPGGIEIYRASGWQPSILSDTASLGPFAGGMRVRVALRQDAVARLSGGLIPTSRVPVWVGLLLLTGLLTAIIVRNLQREHELARLRADFTASVSHELRTPLSQILLFGETLTLGRTRSDAERARAGEVIVREARRLMQLVENALQFSRAERPEVTLRPERLRLAPLVREIIAGFEPLAVARGVKVCCELDEMATTFVDRAAFRQMLINLIDNAIKYGPPGQRITVTLTAAEILIDTYPALLAPKQKIARRTVRICVDDEGPGIQGRSREDIWAAFVRGRCEEGAPGTGCGLGLAVVRELAERHNGRTWVESVPEGRGARFIIELPWAEAPAQSPEAEDDDSDVPPLPASTVSA